MRKVGVHFNMQGLWAGDQKGRTDSESLFGSAKKKQAKPRGESGLLFGDYRYTLPGLFDVRMGSKTQRMPFGMRDHDA